MNQNRAMRVGFGITPVIMVLLTLLFTSFGALSYQTASADAKLTDKTIQSARQYYEADSLCEETLAKVDQAFHAAKQQYGSIGSQFQEQILEECNALNPDMVVKQEDQSVQITFHYPMNDTNQYELSLLCFPKDDRGAYKVSTRKVTNTAEWNSNSLEVWIGD